MYEKTDKVDFIKIKTALQKTMSTEQEDNTECEKIFAEDI